MDAIIALLPFLIMGALLGWALRRSTHAHERIDRLIKKFEHEIQRIDTPSMAIDTLSMAEEMAIKTEITNITNRIEILEYQQRARDTIYTPIVKTIEH